MVRVVPGLSSTGATGTTPCVHPESQRRRFIDSQAMDNYVLNFSQVDLSA